MLWSWSREPPCFVIAVKLHVLCTQWQVLKLKIRYYSEDSTTLITIYDRKDPGSAGNRRFQPVGTVKDCSWGGQQYCTNPYQLKRYHMIPYNKYATVILVRYRVRVRRQVGWFFPAKYESFPCWWSEHGSFVLCSVRSTLQATGENALPHPMTYSPYSVQAEWNSCLLTINFAVYPMLFPMKKALFSFPPLS